MTPTDEEIGELAAKLRGEAGASMFKNTRHEAAQYLESLLTRAKAAESLSVQWKTFLTQAEAALAAERADLSTAREKIAVLEEKISVLQSKLQSAQDAESRLRFPEDYR